jgi:recombination protein RecR
MIKSKYLENLIDAITILPGVGRKSAQRMAYQLLNTNPEKSLHLSQALKNIDTKISKCLVCGVFMDIEEVEKQSYNSCHICERQNRDTSIICVIESASDVYTIDESTNYNGYYFVLQGNLSPIDGRGPSEIGLDKLEKRLSEKNIKELILATNTTIEGEATAHYIKNMATKNSIKVSRLAFGLPLNGEIGFLDNETISHAFNERKIL